MHKSLTLRKTIFRLTIFSVAMGYLESAVVVYLRELYYPLGFQFPLVSLPGNIAVTEIIREVATMFMLLSVAFIAGNSPKMRFAWFLYCFAIWDIFYYVFLKLLIGWPESILTWDILFLIPVIWTGPVVTPVIISLTMILLALLIVFYDTKMSLMITRVLIIAGAILIFFSFIWDFSTYMLKEYPFSGLFQYEHSQLALKQYIPSQFNWWLFIAGELCIFIGLSLPFIRSDKKRDAITRVSKVNHTKDNL